MDWKGKLKAIFGFAFKGAKWYVKARYGVDVDKVLAQQKEGSSHD